MYEQLASSDFSTREAATEELIRRGPPIVAELERLKKTDTDSERVARCKTIARLAEFGEYTTLEALEKLRAETVKTALERQRPEQQGRIAADLTRVDRIIERGVRLAPEKDRQRVEAEAHYATGREMYALCGKGDQFWIRLASKRFQSACKLLEALNDRNPNDKAIEELLKRASMLRYATRQMTTLD